MRQHMANARIPSIFYLNLQLQDVIYKVVCKIYSF